MIEVRAIRHDEREKYEAEGWRVEPWGVPHHDEKSLKAVYEKRYGAILADPPWAFKTYSNKGWNHATERHYHTMSADGLTNFRVDRYAAKDCALFLWVVDSHLAEAIELMTAWGFEYKTRAFVWLKTKKSDPTEPSMGMGYWTRKETEECLLGTKGSPKRLSGGVRQVIREPRREHSRKPDEVYDRIERLVGGPYLELFARQRHQGWDSLGDEVDKFSPC